MRGGEVIHQFFSQTDKSIYNPPDQNIGIDNATLETLGFEEGELEMFFEEENINGSQLIERYMEIARSDPYKQNWQTIDEAINTNYTLNVTKPNGNAYTKHDIAKDTLNSFYHGGKRRQKRRKTIKQRKFRRNSRSTRKRTKHRKYRKH